MKTVNITIPEELYQKILESADAAANRPVVDTVEYMNWYDNRTSDGGNFDDCYENGLSDGYEDLAAEIYHAMSGVSA